MSCCGHPNSKASKAAFSVVKPVKLTAEDEKYLAILDETRLRATPPLQSNFRVLALMLYEDSNGVENYVIGMNCECSVIGGALCAERAAVCQLQTKDCKRITKIYIGSDSDSFLTPGTLCREFLQSHADVNTPIILSDNKQAQTATLGEFYPYPCIYATTSRAEILNFGKNFADKVAQVGSITLSSDVENKLYKDVVKATEMDSRDNLYPTRFAGGVLYDDGTFDISWQHKALEYGSSIDPICKLIPSIERKALENRNPKLLMQVDQFGIFHAPYASARAYLCEFNYSNVEVLVHDSTGKLNRITVWDLVPNAPDSIDTFTESL